MGYICKSFRGQFYFQKEKLGVCAFYQDAMMWQTFISEIACA
jgi:hypothetical protein